MPFNGSGIFQRVRNWVADATAGIKIRADYHDAEDDGFAQGLSNCITKDGQTLVTQNIPFNSKRITGLADPINAQDAATKAYADTKLSASGGTINGNLDVVGTVQAYGYRTRTGLGGPYGNNWFNFFWDGNLHAWVDNSDLGVLATQAWVQSVTGNYLPLAGGVITGSLHVNGELVAKAGYLRFTTPGGSGYIIYSGGPNYDLGGGGRIWHSGNFNPASLGTVNNGRWVVAGSHNHTTEGQSEPFGGAAVTGAGYPEAYPHGTMILMYRYLQMYTTGWFTVGYA